MGRETAVFLGQFCQSLLCDRTVFGMVIHQVANRTELRQVCTYYPIDCMPPIRPLV